MTALDVTRTYPSGGATAALGPGARSYITSHALDAVVLSPEIVQALSATYLAVGAVGLLLGGPAVRRRREPARVKARGNPSRLSELVWMTGATIMVLWPVYVLLLPRYAYDWPSVPRFPYSDLVQLVGFGISIAGGLLFFAAASALGKHLTPAIQVQEGHRLVQEGPYRYIRHPVYTAGISVGVGLSVLYLSPVLGSLMVVLAGIAHYRARVEERFLSSDAAFGAAYTDYMARTGRFLPKVVPGH